MYVQVTCNLISCRHPRIQNTIQAAIKKKKKKRYPTRWQVSTEKLGVGKCERLGSGFFFKKNKKQSPPSPRTVHKCRFLVACRRYALPQRPVKQGLMRELAWLKASIEKAKRATVIPIPPQKGIRHKGNSLFTRGLNEWWNFWCLWRPAKQN